MAKEKTHRHFIHQPVFPGGNKALTEFIYKNLQYPTAALEAKAEGMVLVEYDIDYKGRVVATRVIQSVGHGCDEEACRVVKLLQFEVGKNRGVNVLFHQKAKIQFKLPKAAVAPLPVAPPAVSEGAEGAPVVVQYEYTVTSTATAAPEEGAGVVFSYVVRLG